MTLSAITNLAARNSQVPYNAFIFGDFTIRIVPIVLSGTMGKWYHGTIIKIKLLHKNNNGTINLRNVRVIMNTVLHLKYFTVE